MPQWPERWPEAGVPLEAHEKPTRSAFGARLRAARKQRGWSQSVLGVQADMSQQQVQALERGKNAPTLYTVTRLSKALGVPIDDLTGTHLMATDPTLWQELREAVQVTRQSLDRLDLIVQAISHSATLEPR